ncbi:MAG TPA: hypothetical protein VJR89_04140 [Polyangiales bacterium]|nr:hypothetical protein [Polyangiales bacterium]
MLSLARASIVRFALLVAVLQVAACVAEVGEPEDEVEADGVGSELRIRRPPVPPVNPCAVTSCPSGTVCQVQAGAAVCVPGPGQEPVQCGTVTCATGYLCCNASCGICVRPGFACHQLACN